MKSKIRKKAKAKPRRARPKARRIAAPVYPSTEEMSYERALAKSVLDHNLPLDSEESVTLAAAMSSLTLSLKRLSYNYGLTVGRAVYRLFEGRRHYKWYGDSIQDMVLFFEKLGYNYILYSILTDNVEVSIYRKSRVRMGCNIHSFDAGVMSGFLGAARGDYVRVAEVSCCNNGAECCKFTTAGTGMGDPFCTDIKSLSALLKGAQSGGMIRPEYQMLSSEPLMKPEYSNHINSLFFHLGQEQAEGFPDKLSAKALQSAASAMGRLGLGRLDYRARPLKLAILLDGVKAKKEFVDISISFLNGMVGRYFGGSLKARLSQDRKGSYKIIVKQ